ncbi:MAG TPA: hypothetical protein DD727_00505 [Clostridiales bacterium]|nr:hypothetical protein [Clostridiales bacterium]
MSDAGQSYSSSKIARDIARLNGEFQSQLLGFLEYLLSKNDPVSSEAGAAESAPKKKRGRPAKNPEGKTGPGASAPAPASAPALEDAAPKRGRGRPPKAKPDNSAGVPEISLPKRRGRPPKVKVEDVPNPFGVEAVISMDEGKITKRRGRPAKVKNPDLLVAAVTSSEPDITPKRGRGRPRKKPVAESGEAPQEINATATGLPEVAEAEVPPDNENPETETKTPGDTDSSEV